MTDDAANPQPATPDRQADDRLVHALLLHVYDPDAPGRRERRVARLMRGIDEAGREPARPGDEPRAAPPAVGSRRLGWTRRSAWNRRSAWAAAALVLIGVGLFAVLRAPSPAAASLGDVLGALTRPGDRTYRITVQPPDGGPDARPGLDHATLYLRDGSQYLLARRDPKGGQAFDGFDGRRSWRVRAGTLAEIREGPGAGGIPAPQLLSEVPQVDLPRTLHSLQADYTVERLDLAPLSSGRDALRHVLARRRSNLVKGPETVEIWADAGTGLPRLIVFDRAKFQGSTEPRRLTFELTSESRLPPDWFGPTPHLGSLGDPPAPTMRRAD